MLLENLCCLLRLPYISRYDLLPFGPDWLPILGDSPRPSCPASAELLALLGGCRTNPLPLLLCALLSADHGKIRMPSSFNCELVLRISNLFECAKRNCPLLDGFRCLPPSIWGRIARSTSCILVPHCCISLALLFAISSPTTLIQPSHVGWLSTLDTAFLCHCLDRIVCLSSERPAEHSAFRPLCEPFSQKGLYLPLSLSEVRAILFRCKNRRYVRRWFTTFDVAIVRPEASSIKPSFSVPHDTLLFAAFSDKMGAMQWCSGSSALNDWIFTGPTLNNWSSELQSA